MRSVRECVSFVDLCVEFLMVSRKADQTILPPKDTSVSSEPEEGSVVRDVGSVM